MLPATIVWESQKEHSGLDFRGIEIPQACHITQRPFPLLFLYPQITLFVHSLSITDLLKGSLILPEHLLRGLASSKQERHFFWRRAGREGEGIRELLIIWTTTSLVKRILVLHTVHNLSDRAIYWLTLDFNYKHEFDKVMIIMWYDVILSRDALCNTQYAINAPMAQRIAAFFFQYYSHAKFFLGMRATVYAYR